MARFKPALAAVGVAVRGVEMAWIEEAKRRWKEIEEGKVEGIPAEEVFARVRQKLHETRNHPDYWKERLKETRG